MSDSYQIAVSRIAKANVNQPRLITVQSGPIKQPTIGNKNSSSSNSSYNIADDDNVGSEILLVPIAENPDNTATNGLSENMQVGEENQDQNDSKLTNCITRYLNCMYYTATSPLHIKKGSGKTLKIFSITQTIVFWLFISCAMLESVKLLKYYTQSFFQDQKLLKLVSLALYILNFLGRLAFVKVVGLNSQSFLKVIQDLDQSAELSNLSRKRDEVSKYLPIFLMVSSVTCSVSSSIFGGVSLTKWSLKETLADHSYSFATDLLQWTTDNATEVKLINQFQKSTTPLTLTFAILEAIIVTCDYLQDLIVEDLILMAALTLKEYGTRFQKKLDETSTSSNETNNIGSLWEDYRKIRHVSETINNSFGYLMTFMHFNNMLNFQQFLLRLLGKIKLDVRIIFNMFSILKAAYLYYTATSTLKTNSRLRSWIHKTCWKTGTEHMVENVNVAVLVLLDELKMKPFGSGEGKFQINTDFIQKFCTLVVSYFLFIVKEREGTN